jgi:HlyD family secretion protein
LQSLTGGADADSIRQAELNLEQAQNNLASAELEREVTLLPTTPDSVRRQLDTTVANAEIAVELAEISLRQTTDGPPEEALKSAQAAVAASRAQVAGARATLEDIDSRIAQAEANVVQAEAGVVQSRASVTQAEANLALLLAGGSARELAAAEINVAQSELAVSRAERDLESTVLRSPANGTVLSVHAAPGTPTGPGSAVLTLLDTGKLEFHTTNVTERDLTDIRPGQSATVTLKTYPDQAIQARVLRIGLQAGEPVGDSATFPIVLELDTNGLSVLPGMTGRAEIQASAN